MIKPDTHYKKTLKMKQSNACVRWLLCKRKQMELSQVEEQQYTNDECYSQYVSWAEDGREKVVSKTAFGDLLNKNGFTLRQKKVPQANGRRVSVYSRMISIELINKHLSEYIIDEEETTMSNSQ